ncbi:DNA repair protein rhp26 [Coemansia erecta]|uniref:DNA repair protein rhp26 n=1 Tax=Coemansia erecta TaxID=147472 RepID=A0A9W8CNL9_9FUNG|nr:DNA repair protein rhp26 [Coemansia erecta]
MSTDSDNGGNANTYSELQGLSELGVHFIDQQALEQTVHTQAARDMAQTELEVEQKRLLRLQIQLDKRIEQLEKTRNTLASTKATTKRYQTARERAKQLEDEIEQTKTDMAEINSRMREIRERVRVTEPSASLATMLVPRRQAAINAEQRRYKTSTDDQDVEPEDSEETYMPPSKASTGRRRANKRVHSDDEFVRIDFDSDDASYHEESLQESTAESRSIDPSDDELEDGGLLRRSRLRELDLHDDGNEAMYQSRLFGWSVARWRARQAADSNSGVRVEVDDSHVPRAQLIEEPFLDDPDDADHRIRAHDRVKPPLRVPRQIWTRLLEYQKAAMQWMFTLHQQNAGGVLGDEMGLGKTVQIVAFLASLYHSRMLSSPSIIVCPATLMRQWVREIHTWWPALRVVILHSTGYAMRIGISADEAQGGAAGSETIGQPADLSTNLPADAEASIWEAAQKTNSEFGNTVGGPIEVSGDLVLEYNSDDDYEYDAYGSRLRRKRRPRGYVDWHRRQQQQHRNKKKKRVKRAGMSQASKESMRRAHALIEHVFQHGHIVVVTYSGLQIYRDLLLSRRWGYAVLDEGHMIRNPDAEATLACKRLDTRHRMLVTGTPIQNNLTELWSLFDFIFPGRLGTLPVFNNQFAVPITVGGYASASELQVRAAYRCACILRDLIDPYLLRRLKADVARDLPQKTEQVLFCRLTPMQRSAYKAFLRSPDMERILLGKLQMLFGVDVARKICDHPDLLLLSTLGSARSTHTFANGIHAEALAVAGNPHGLIDNDSEDEQGIGASDALQSELPADYGNWKKSGKLTVVRVLLRMWKPQGHKVLIFCQTRQMLDIIERMVSSLPDTAYRRMDGSTPVQHRTALVDEYNRDKNIFVFLLTTRVGGLGINLTGANRVILYSPDWNPSSDMQARERAWRLGQTRDVAIYRLMTAGTIEEKIYNRQIYKQFLSNKILSDPNQKRFFQTQSLQDLFSLAGFNDGQPEEDDTDQTSGSHQDCNSSESGPRLGTTSTGRMFAQAQLFPLAQSEDTERASEDAAPVSHPDTDSYSAIDGIVRLEQYRNPDDSEADRGSQGSDTPKDGEPSSNTTGNRQKQVESDGSENRVLQSLFKMTGVMHSALEHDVIVGSGQNDGDSRTVEREADRIANEARVALRESQRTRRQMDVRVPTWTGASGQAGMPSSGDGRAGSGRVAPPPSAMLESRLPTKVQEIQRQQQQQRELFGLRAVGTPRHYAQDTDNRNSFDHGSSSAALRRAAPGHSLPPSSVVKSISVKDSYRPSLSSGFGTHLVAGVHQGATSTRGAPLSSASLLAGLKARSTDMAGATSSATTSIQFRHGQQRIEGRPVSNFSSGSRSSSGSATGSPGLAKTRPHGLRASAESSDKRMSSSGKIGTGSPPVAARTGKLPSSAAHHPQSQAQALAQAQPAAVLTNNDKVLIERIRAVLISNGGEMSNKALLDAFRPEFSLDDQPRLKSLALNVADLESRKPSNESSSQSSRIGIGRIVQKVWKLKTGIE